MWRIIKKIKLLKNNRKKRVPHGDTHAPFFILGCVRSGTTLLRNILRMHPRLECPEETHFFRWGDPFGTPRYLSLLDNPLMKKHMQMDGISPGEFEDILSRSKTKKDLAENYGRLFLEKKDNSTGRWFDKTPQNVYGLLELSALFPESKFIHIVRNPLNVVSSLIEGKVMPPHSLRASINYWMESMLIINEYKGIGAHRLYEVTYENLTNHPEDTVSDILQFVDEDPSALKLPANMVHIEQNKYRQLLKPEDVSEVRRMCDAYMARYGY